MICMKRQKPTDFCIIIPGERRKKKMLRIVKLRVIKNKYIKNKITMWVNCNE